MSERGGNLFPYQCSRMSMRGLMELLTRPHIRTRLGRSRHDACFWHSQIHEMVGRRGTHVTQVWEGRLLPSSKRLDGEFAASIEIKRATIKSEPQPVGASTLSLNLGQSRRLPNFRFWRWCGHADTRSIVLARRAINVRKLCIATISKIELAQPSYGSTWPLPACPRLAAFGGTSAGVTFRSLTGGF
jgi:hypothetical protein